MFPCHLSAELTHELINTSISGSHIYSRLQWLFWGGLIVFYSLFVMTCHHTRQHEINLEQAESRERRSCWKAVVWCWTTIGRHSMSVSTKIMNTHRDKWLRILCSSVSSKLCVLLCRLCFCGYVLVLCLCAFCIWLYALVWTFHQSAFICAYVLLFVIQCFFSYMYTINLPGTADENKSVWLNLAHLCDLSGHVN